MPCEVCGGRAKGRYCRPCERDIRYGNYQTAEQLQKDDRDRAVDVVCTNCDEEYTTDGDDACPECGERRRRYDGPLASEEPAMTDGGEDWDVKQQSLDGARPEGQTTFDGDVRKEGGVGRGV